MRQFDGACHCGNITFQLSWPIPQGAVPVRRCGCSFCRKHGAVYTSHPDARLRASVRDSGELLSYSFATGTARWVGCATCGVMCLVVCTIEGRDYAVVNVNAIPELERGEERVMDFDGEELDERLSRRRGSWIGDYRLEILQP
ncbi:MAG: hypothetical protein GY906_27200 [bacterium]|nr:hypothetical protein [bacterium]